MQSGILGPNSTQTQINYDDSENVQFGLHSGRGFAQQVNDDRATGNVQMAIGASGVQANHPNSHNNVALYLTDCETAEEDELVRDGSNTFQKTCDTDDKISMLKAVFTMPNLLKKP